MAIFPDKDSAMPIEDYDSGLTGVIDRLVAEVRSRRSTRQLIAQRADYYLVGEPFTCSHRSSYVQSIVTQRRKDAVKAAGGHHDRVNEHNVVDYFGPLVKKANALHFHY